MDLIDDSAPFFGLEQEARDFLRDRLPPYYVYALCLPERVPIYVGKGVNDRVFDHVKEARRKHRISEPNPHKCNKIRKLETAGTVIHYAIMSVHETNIEAERQESLMIQRYLRVHEGGTLTNLAPGRESVLGVHPDSLARHAATLSFDPDNPARDPETHILNEFMASILAVKSNPLKPRSKYCGRRVEHTTGTTRAKMPSARSAAALAISASLNGGLLEEGAIIPRIFVYNGLPGILENGVSNDIIGTRIAEMIPAADPVDEMFRITRVGARIIMDLLERDRLDALGLVR